MSNLNENLHPLKKLNPFGRFCVTIGHLPTSYMESLTYEEQLIWFCQFLEKTVIPAINNNAEATEELQNLYEELKAYVDHYFDNLNVQTEINNKLDEMVENGTLAEIINQQIFDDLNERITTNENDIDNINKKIFGETPKFHFIDRHGEYGDAIAIELQNNNVLIDLGTTDGLDNLIAYLVINNITKFKYMIISHWDLDHSSTTEGFKRVIENANLDFSDCTFILPPECDWTRMTGVDGQETRCTEITNYLIANNYTIKYPTEKEIITIDDNNFMRFYNYNPEFITEYENIMVNDADMEIDYTQINNISGVMEFNTYGKTFLFTGDIFREAEENISNELPKINVLKIPHHGINRYNSPEFLQKINPEIGVIMNTTATYPLRPYTRFYCDNDAQLFTTNESGNIIISIDDYNNIIVNSTNGSYNPISNNVIRSGYDLNDYILQGIYFNNNLDSDNPVLNLPPNYNNMFVLKVETITNSVVYQTLTTMNNQPYYWIRKTTDAGENWTDWKRISIYNFSYIRAGITNDYTISSANFEKIELDKLLSSNDLTESLSITNNGDIKIGKGVSQIEVSANVNISSLTASDRIMVAIYKNNNVYTRIDKNVSGSYDSANIAGQIIDVTENDTISLYVRNLQSRGTVSSSSYATNFIVKTIY